MKNRKTLALICLSLLMTAVIKLNAQNGELLTLGLGYKITYTPPSGWVKASGFLTEKCWNSPDNLAKVCLSTRSKSGTTPDQLLDNLAVGQKPVKCDKKEYKGDDFVTVWRECEVSVSGRTESRLWSVTLYDEAPDAVLIALEYRDISPEKLQSIMSTIGEIELSR